jgi:hypothetical protein
MHIPTGDSNPDFPDRGKNRHSPAIDLRSNVLPRGFGRWQKGFFRAGHAHAGVLLLLSLVYLLYLPRADFSNALEWIAGGVLLAGILAQSGGFFLHLGVGHEGRPSVGTKLSRAGALLIAAALVTLAVGLIQTA